MLNSLFLFKITTRLASRNYDPGNSCRRLIKSRSRRDVNARENVACSPVSTFRHPSPNSLRIGDSSTSKMEHKSSRVRNNVACNLKPGEFINNVFLITIRNTLRLNLKFLIDIAACQNSSEGVKVFCLV